MPAEVLGCGHLVCEQCCKEFANGFIESPFCEWKGKWTGYNIPSIAGIRVLSIDGAGVEGLGSILLLQKIEEQLGIAIHQLFDLIVELIQEHLLLWVLARNIYQALN